MPRRSFRAIAFALLVTPALVSSLVTSAPASIGADEWSQRNRSLLVAPAQGERIVSSAARFAFETPRGSSNPTVLVSRAAFDPSGWQEIPASSDLIALPAQGRAVSLSDAGVDVPSETTVWWAVATRDPGTGRLSVSEVRSFTALPKFRNRVAASPFILPGVRGTLEPPSRPGARRIRLGAGFDFLPAEGEPPVAALEPKGLAVERGNPAGLETYLVQFDHAPAETEREAIARTGGRIIGYVPDDAYLVRLAPGSRARLEAAARPSWVGSYHAAYKRSPLVNANAPAGSFYVLLFPDADLTGARTDLAALGIAVEQESDNGVNKLLRIRAEGVALAGVTALSSVEWVEPVLPAYMTNDLVQWVVQTNATNSRRVWDMGIRGQGQVVMTSDSGISVTHDQFRDPNVAIPGYGDYPTHRKIIAYKPGSTDPTVTFGDYGSVYHGTHTACTLAGSDDPVGGASARDGVAKEAKIYFMDIGGPNPDGSIFPPDDLNDLFGPPYAGNAGGAARISSNSWGSAVAGTYTLRSMQADQFTWDHPDFFLAYSAGNSGDQGAMSVGAPASAKNVSAIGAVWNGLTNNIYALSSRGPTADGRRKPTFVAPGIGTTSTTGVWSASGASTNAYQQLQGTSMASPGATGAVTLMRQYLVDGWYPSGTAVPAHGFSPSAALLRAMAINAASRVTGFNIPDQNIGWGRIVADSVLYFAGDTRKLLLVDNTDGLAHDQYIEYNVNVVDGTLPLEVSLCWTDYPGSPAAAMQIVNNLDLTVSKGATVYKGNVFASGVSVAGGVYDSLNVEEGVRVNAPATGLWTIRISAPRVPAGPQPFGLCVTGGVGGSAGTLALDRAEYGATGQIEMQVVDGDAASVVVSVVSGSESTPETVTLSGSNGLFSGALLLSPFPSANDDGTLTVSNGDPITATYVDATSGTSLIASAAVSFEAPLISNVHIASQDLDRCTVAWATDQPSTSRVYYGLTPGLELGAVDGVLPGSGVTHEVVLQGLAPGATYYYDVQSIGLAGGVTRDNLGGQHYRFTKDTPGEVLLLVGNPDFPRTAAWENALQAKGYDYDVWIGTLADNATLGDRTTGLRSYRAVLWQTGLEDYPPFSDSQRAVIDQYLAGGGRLLVVGHDIGWAFSDPASPVYTLERKTWLNSTLKAIWQADPASWNSNRGVAADPISGAYTGGVTYTPFRSGGAGDEIDINVAAGGSASYVWRNNEATVDDIGMRWESPGPVGDPGTAVYGGQTSRLVDYFFEFTAMGLPPTSQDPVRDDILDKTVVWLYGRPRPTVSLTSPNGGETLTGPTASIMWTESTGPGRTVASRTLEYSLDGGASWNLITSSAGPSPYSWNLASVPNTSLGRVRVRIVDDGSPNLNAFDVSAANFTIDQVGGDVQGPIVIPGSVDVTPNPIVSGNAATLMARVSETYAGGGGVTAAEWSFGPNPAPGGSGTPMSGSFGSATVDVSAVLSTAGFPGQVKLWVRGRDDSGNWGPASLLDAYVKGTGPVAVETIPTVAFLAQNAPNPFAKRTAIRFGMPHEGAVDLSVFDVAGRLVRHLVQGVVPAGEHRALWDGRDENGAAVRSGIYYYRLVTPEKTFEKRLVTLD